jgi:uncharacterized membrane protein YphA (DoxX/SURF4 family)
VGLFVKGIQFLIDRDALGELISRPGQLDMVAGGIMHYVVLAHLGGGALLAFGLLTRIGAAAQIPVLFGATFFVHKPQSVITYTEQFEFAALVLFLLCLFVIFGAGRFSLDYLLWGAKEVPDEKLARVAAGLGGAAER